MCDQVAVKGEEGEGEEEEEGLECEDAQKEMTYTSLKVSNVTAGVKTSNRPIT